MDPASVRQSFHDDLLARHLNAIFGAIDPAAQALLRRHLQWVEIAGGDTLMAQGDAGDSMYLVVSGRLRAYVHDGGRERMVGEMARGQIVGELSLYTDEPRAATVVAVRDSVLVRLAKAEFHRLLESSAQVSIALTRQIVHRLKGDHTRASHDRPVAIGLLPVGTAIDLAAFGAQLAARLAERLPGGGRVRLVAAADIDAALRQAGINDSDDDPQAQVEANRRVALLLDEIEADNDVVLLLADDHPSAWTQRCCRHCDELLLLADAARPAALHPTEQQILMRRPARTEVAEILVLLHAEDRQSPQGTAAWLARRPLAGHLHIRPARPRDIARLARIQSRTAVGLVLAGGGARGFAHLGVYRALREHGIDIDWVGGTSIGAVMAAYVGSDQPFDTVMANAKRAFAVNPTGDFNLFPMISLFKGLRLRGILGRAVEELVGFDADIEDLWKNYHCVATNYSRASEQRIERGNLVQALLASISIPGALPPVIHDGELLCDGGTFNNFPVDVMRTMRGVGHVIGIDLNMRTPQRIDHTEMPGTLALLRDRFRPPGQRRYRLPSLPTYLMTVTGLYSMSRQSVAQQQCDLYFHPALDRVGMLQWNRIDQIVSRGYTHALEVIAAMDAAQRQHFGVHPPGAVASERVKEP